MKMSEDFLDSLPESLRSTITNITRALPQSLTVFEEVYNYGLSQGSGPRGRKKVKTESGEAISNSNIIFKLEDVSLLSPIRKRLDFVLYLAADTRKPAFSLLKDGKVELTVADLNKNILTATFLPIPEKDHSIYLFIQCRNHPDSKDVDSILLVLRKDKTIHQFQLMGVLPNNVSDFNKCLEYMRKQAILTGFRIGNPFNSPVSNHVMPFHVACHRGRQEGTLYFLQDVLIFGFRKPILVFDVSKIESITYTSITRLTFNVTLITNDGERYEFSMIDQSEYSRIDEYVRSKEVKDKSMSEELKAKTQLKNNSQQQSEEYTSILQESVKQLENTQDVNINNANFGSDDDEEDRNFENEEVESEPIGSSMSESADVEEEEQEVKADGATIGYRENQNDTGANVEDGGLENIAIEVEDYDDEEGSSGVEYN